MTNKHPPRPPWSGALKALSELIFASFQTKKYQEITADKLNRLIESGEKLTIVDCRDPESFALVGHIPGALNVTYKSYMKSVHKVPKGNPVVTVCYAGFYSRAAAQKLAHHGHSTVMSLKGGMEAWCEADYVLEIESPAA